MKPLVLLAALLVSAAAHAAAQDLPGVKFKKSEAATRDGIDPKDGEFAIDMLGLQCARIQGRKKSEPCTAAEMRTMSESKDARLKDVGQKLAHLESCSNDGFKPSTDPDAADKWINGICTGAKYEIMTYGGKTTDPQANSGMIQYMRDSVLADCALYNSAVLFYGQLKDMDLTYRPTPGHGAGVSMAGTLPESQNLGPAALAAVKKATGREDAYLAMKVIALYGHDNKFNFLSASGCARCGGCQLKVLDALKPNANSSLYMNEAIGSPIGSQWVEDGTKLFGACREAATQKDASGAETGHWVAERELCGEYSEYQTGYYHLNAAAFLQCHCNARGHGLAGAAIDDLTKAWQRDGYMHFVGEYKINAITKWIKRGLDNPSHTPALRLVSLAFPAHYEKGMTAEQVEKLPWAAWCADPANFTPGTCGPSHIRFAKTAMQLFAYEVRYRLHLHHLGMLAGNAYCRGAKIEHPRCK